LHTYLQRFALKPEPVKFVKGLLRSPFTNFTVVRLIGNRCRKAARFLVKKFSMIWQSKFYLRYSLPSERIIGAALRAAPMILGF